MKNYKSQSFVRKIEVNLANVSSKPTDEFQLVKAYYDIDAFDCELCDHKNCMYAFEVKNLQTGSILKVGSECIHHFEDKGVDINLAEGLMRRVMSASNKARRDLKRRLGEEAWEALSEEERSSVKWYEQSKFIDELGKQAYKELDKDVKREMVLNEFLTLQTKELLANVARNKSILSEEDVELILELGMEDEMQEAVNRRDAIVTHQKIREKENQLLKYIREAPVLDQNKLDEMRGEILAIDPEANMNWSTFAYEARKREDDMKSKLRAEYSWLIDYDGPNYIVHDIKSYLLSHGQISPKQHNLAYNIIEAETEPKDDDFDKHIEELRINGNKFINSVYEQYKKKGFVSEKQRTAIEKLYEKRKETESHT